MKVGLRTPSIKKSIKAQTTGKVKRKVKSAVNPLYGKKGMGLINDPEKAIYNKVYNKTTISIGEVAKKIEKSNDKVRKELVESIEEKSASTKIKNPNFCAYCGNKLSETANFCAGCGTKISKR